MVESSNESDLLDFVNEPEVNGRLFEGEEIIFSCYVYKKNKSLMGISRK